VKWLNPHAFTRGAAYAAFTVVMLASGWGWARLLYSIDTILRHERIALLHAGGLVNHEQRLQVLEDAIGGGRRLPYPRKPTFGDLVCSDAAREPRPDLRADTP
jgi:hypothetical protein